jgi:hypothetical protein
MDRLSTNAVAVADKDTDQSQVTANLLRWLQFVLFLLLSILWLKLAYDVVFDFGPESAREWFPLRAVISICTASLAFSLLNIFALVHPDECDRSLAVTKTRKALITTAFLGSFFACWLAETLTKALDMYLIIPTIILLLILSSDSGFRKRTHYIFLALSIFLLIPNDKCANPQNWWWINKIGASPMTYVAPVNILLCLTTKVGDRTSVRVVCVILVALYYLACVYHRLGDGGY